MEEKKKRPWRGALGCLAMIALPVALVSGAVAYVARQPAEDATRIGVIVVVLLTIILASLLSGLIGLVVGGVVASPKPRGRQARPSSVALDKWLTGGGKQEGA